MKKQRLGRGLEELGISELLSEIKATPELAPKSELRKLPLELLEPGQYQPRQVLDKDALEDLANSIRAQGVIQPIVVRSIAGGRYEIIAGERRWRASQLAELTEIPAVVRNISDETAIAVALIENIQRENLNAIEEAGALQRLIAEFGMTHQEVAQNVGKSRTTVTNLLRLLGLRTEVKMMLGRGEFEMGHARALLSLSESLQLQAANIIVDKGLSVRETERLVKKMLNPKPKSQIGVTDPNILSLQQELSDKLGARVIIKNGRANKGQLLINYNNLQELEGIIERL